jgi:hypothetical protein
MPIETPFNQLAEWLSLPVIATIARLLCRELSSDQITLGSSELKAFTTTGYSPGFYPDMSFYTLRTPALSTRLDAGRM